MDVPHANAGHRREFKSHLYNRLLRVVFWLFGYFLLRMGCKCNRLMRSGRFLFSLLLLLLLFGTPQVYSGSMGLWVNSTSKANWPGVTSCLPLAWTRKSLQSRQPFENALEVANELWQVQVQQVQLQHAAGAASAGNLFDLSQNTHQFYYYCL